MEITIDPDSGYRLKGQIQVKPYECEGADVLVRRVSGTRDTFMFTMPKYPVEIKLEFEQGPQFPNVDRLSLGADAVQSADVDAENELNRYDKVIFGKNLAGENIEWKVLSNKDGKMLLYLERGYLAYEEEIIGGDIEETISLFAIFTDAERACFLPYSGSSSYQDMVTDEKGNSVVTTYTQPNAVAGLFLPSVEDLRTYLKYEDEFDNMWLRSSTGGNRAYVKNGEIKADGQNDRRLVKPMLLIDTSKILLTKHASVTTLPYANPNMDDMAGGVGNTWTLIIKDSDIPQPEVIGAYRDLNRITAKDTNDIIVVTNELDTEALLAVRGSRVLYYAEYNSRGNFRESDTLAEYHFNNAVSKMEFNSESDQLYMLAHDSDNHAGALSLFELHEHDVDYISEIIDRQKAVVTMSCINADGEFCIIDVSKAWLVISSPQTSSSEALRYTGTVSEFALAFGEEFAPTEPAIKYGTLSSEGSFELTKTGDVFEGGSGALVEGGIPNEAGEYVGRVYLNDTKTKYIELPFVVETDVYSIRAIATNPFGGNITFIHNDSNPINGRIHPESVVTITLTADSGKFVGGLDVETLGGFYTSFAATESEQINFATLTYTVTMPAAHIKLEPWFVDHEHHWAEAWTSDGSYHWHDCLAINCTVGAANLKDGYGEHEWKPYEDNENGTHTRICSVCGFTETSEHSWTGFIYDDTQHWKECLVSDKGCTAVTEVGVHTWDHWTIDNVYHSHECTVCGFVTDKAVHDYTIEDATLEYLKSESTCTQYSVYYKHCICGVTSSAYTFTSGALEPHITGSALVHNGTEHWYECENCATHMAVTAHTYDIKEDTANYLKSAATCTHEAVYYKHCTCGATSAAIEAEFSTGSALPHPFSPVWTSDGSFHWHVCTVCHTTEGSFGPHENCRSTAGAYLLVEPTCTLNAIYYESCSVCGLKLTTTFEALGTAKGHKGTDPIITGGGHSYICSVCHVEFNHAEHSFAEATCTKAATCTVCGATSGTAVDHQYEWQIKGEKHVQKCTACGAEINEGSHTGGKSTCTQQAICSTCYLPYGKTASHKYNSYASDEAMHWHVCDVCHGEDDHVSHTAIMVITDRAICVAPTCTMNGIYYYTCRECNRILDTTFCAFGSQRHSFTAYEYADNPSEGHIKVCEYCRAPEDENSIYYHRYNTADISTVGSVHCTESGLDYWTSTGHAYKCIDCGYTVVEAHTHGDITDFIPTCNRVATCYICNASFGGFDDDHHTRTPYKDLTTTSHSYEYTCGCEKTSGAGTVTKEHRWAINTWPKTWQRFFELDDFVLVKAATCTQYAVYQQFCGDCWYGSDYVIEGLPTFSAVDEGLAQHEYTASGPGAVLKTAANCVSPAEFYCVCAHCGTNPSIYTDYDEDGNPIAVDEYGDPLQTFTSGEALGHSWGDPITNGAIIGYEGRNFEEYHYYKCSECGVVTGAAHVYDVKITGDAFKISEATCTQYAVYGSHCVCGAYSTDHTFTDGALKPHEADTTKYYHDGSQHWHLCKHCATETEHMNATNHAFDIEEKDAKYLKSAASCTQAAVYYKHCVCGATGSATFTTGSTIAHPTAGAVYGHDGTNHWFVCDACSTKVAITDHAFSNVEDSKFLISAATCTLDAVYYQSCVCGATSSATFTTAALGHSLENDVLSTDGSCHYQHCSVCGITVGVEHSGGTATCTLHAVCTKCGTPYGELAPHDFAPATCLSASACRDCGLETGSALGHDFSGTWIILEDGHYKKCTRCDATSEAIAHCGGTATCTQPGVCSECGVEYIAALGHVYTTTCAPCEDNSDQHYYVCTREGCSHTEAAVHDYKNKITDNKYLISEATCTLPAYYYYVCDCGVTSSAYYTTGTACGHNFVYTSHSAAGYTYTCSVCGNVATAELKINGGVASDDGIKEFVFDKEEIKPVTFDMNDEWKGEHSNLTSQAISYTSCVSAGAVTASVILSDRTVSVNYRIIKADQHPVLTMAGYVYEGQLPTPAVLYLEEDPVVHYYIRKSPAMLQAPKLLSAAPEGWIDWEDVTNVTLTPGSYQMYAEVEETYDYNATRTAVMLFAFEVKKADQLLTAKSISIPFETIGMKLVVSGYRTGFENVSFAIKSGQPTDVITINPATGVIKTLRGGQTVVVVSAEGNEFFNPASIEVNVEVTSRALNVEGIEMVADPFYFGQEVEFEGVPSASTKKVEKAVPGWTYNYVGTRQGVTFEDIPYERTETAPTQPGIYKLLIEVLDDNAKYRGVQTIYFEILRAVPTLTAIEAEPITYYAMLGTSTVSGIAVNTYEDEKVVTGTWYFTDGDVITPHVIDSDTTLYEVTFVPDDLDHYVTATAFTTVHVNRREPNQISGDPMTCACLSYTYAAAEAPAVPTISAFDDGTRNGKVTYYYCDAYPDPGETVYEWKNIGSKTLDAGKYYIYAVIEGDDYLPIKTEPITFRIYKGMQPAPTALTISGFTATVAEEDRAKALEYSLDGEKTWFDVPALDGNGSFKLEGFDAKGEPCEICLRQKESNNYYASPSTSTVFENGCFSISYNANGGQGSISPQFSESGESLIVASPDGISRKGYSFVKWNNQPDGSGTPFDPGNVQAKGEILYAVWTPNAFLVAFDGNGADGTMEDQEFIYDQSQALNNVSFTGNASTGSIFAGWALNPNGPVYYSSGASIKNLAAEGVVTLYAIWTDEVADDVPFSYSSKVDGEAKFTLKKANQIVSTTEGAVSTMSGIGFGVLELDQVPDGVYDLVAEVSAAGFTKTITKMVVVRNGQMLDSDQTQEFFIITDSRANSVLVVADGTRQVVVGNLDSEAESKREEDKEIIIRMEVAAVDEAEVVQGNAPADAAAREIKDGILAIRKIAQTSEIEFLDINVFETISESGVETEYQIRKTHRVIEIVIPFDMTGKHSVQVYRAHDGVGQQLRELDERPLSGYADGTYFIDWTNGLIYLYAQKYSVYGIGYNAPVYYERTYTGEYNDCPKDKTCPIDPYTDAENKAWYHDGVHFCIENSIMIGRDTNIFVPDGDILRGEIITMLWRIAGKPAAKTELSFEDIDENAYYIDALRWAVAAGVAEGYDEAHFGPADVISREQIAAMLYRFAQIRIGAQADSAKVLIYKDAGNISSWAKDAMNWCTTMKIVQGKPGNLADPQGLATRAEAACMAQRFCVKIEYFSKD